MELEDKIVEIYEKAACCLPDDVVNALEYAEKNETHSGAKQILTKILENISQAKIQSKPICQDTGTPLIYVNYSNDYLEKDLKKIIQKATDRATKEIPLRPNAVDVLTGKNIGNIPVIHFSQSEKLSIDILLKGGGSENVSDIYALPDKELQAERDLNGVEKCILQAVIKAQGKGCPPYIIGVAIGGNMEEAARLSKKQLLRKLDDENSISELKEFEKKVLKKINRLGIGPAGLGGDSTALAVKVAVGKRHPASFFVGISFSCWCLRRQSL